MSLFSSFKRKSNTDEVKIADTAVSAEVSDADLDFVKGAAETAEDVIRAHDAQLKAEAEKAAQEQAEQIQAVPANPVTEDTNNDSGFIYQKEPVTQHELVLDLPEFHPSDEPAIALIRGDEGYFAKDLVSGLMAMGNCEADARERLITLLAQSA